MVDLSNNKKFKGIWAPLPTPFNRRGGIDKDRTKQLVVQLIDKGIDGLFPLGTSGEFALLTHREKIEISKAVIDSSKSKVPVVVGISDTCMQEVVNLGKEAKDIGADAVISTPPYYYSVGQKGIINFFETIASKIDLPIMLYNIPDFTHNLVTPETVEYLAEKEIICGMKYTQNDLSMLMRFISKCSSKISVFTGSDALALSDLQYGGAGAIMASANVLPELASSVYDNFSSGNIEGARNAQLKLLPAIQAISLGNFPAGLKYCMKLVGKDVGEVREPLEPLTDDEKKKAIALMKEYDK